MSYSVKFSFEVEWFDRRLTWKDLRADDYLNIPDENTQRSLWVPTIIFENTEKMMKTQNDNEAKISEQDDNH